MLNAPSRGSSQASPARSRDTLDPWRGSEPIPLTPAFVEDIHKEGGTVLKTSRGPVDVSVAVDNLIRRKIDMLFVVGAHGTL